MTDIGGYNMSSAKNIVTLYVTYILKRSMHLENYLKNY